MKDIKFSMQVFSNPTTMIQYFKNGQRIQIKKSTQGSFTEYCGGKVTNECICKAKQSNNPKIRKKAIFAENARKWNK